MILPDDTPASPPKGQPPLPAADAPYAPGPPAYPGHEPPVPIQVQLRTPQAPSSQPGPSYSASPLLMPTTPLVPLRHAEPAGKRFLKAFAVAVFVWILLGIMTDSILEAARYAHRRERWSGIDDARQDYPEYHTAWPIPEDGRQVNCTSAPSDWVHEDGHVFTSFDLPLDADVLYVFSRGVQSAGNIVIIQDDRVHDTDKVHVDIAAVHSTPHFLKAVSVCSLERRWGESGIGIFTPLSYPRNARLPVLDFEVTVRLPKPSNVQPLRIGTLETRLPLFTHQVGDLSRHVLFDHLDLQSQNARISSQSVDAIHLSVGTKNSPIEGNYEASGSLELTTSNEKISAQITLVNDNGRNPSKAVLKTSNAAITSDIKLQSSTPEKTEGAFTVSSTATNGRLSLNFVDAPVDSKLQLVAKTSNGPAYVSLHPTFEGNFKLRTSNAKAEVEYEGNDIPDPAARNRTRDASILNTGNFAMGKVLWDGEHKGAVDIRTSNARVTLRV